MVRTQIDDLCHVDEPVRLLVSAGPADDGADGRSEVSDSKNP